MAIELRFVKGDGSSTTWGFRLTGGAEYNEPITVVKVNPGSLAENVGLRVGDVVVRVNDTPFSGLTHVQAHDIITKAGNEFILAIRRDEGGGLLFRETDVLKETINNAEISNILQTAAVSTEQHDQHSEVSCMETVNAIDSTRTGFIEVEITIKDQQDVFAEEETTTSNPQTLKIANAVEVRESNCETTTTQKEITAEIESTTQERKWSTFLQKPKHPKPKPKKTESERPKGEPYRVVIKKQKKKEQQQEQQQEEVVAEVDITNSSQTVLSSSSQEIVEAETTESVDTEYHIEHYEGSHKEDFELDVSITTQVQEETYVEVENDDDIEAAIERACRETTSLSVEEQLVQVQKQLQQLSQLPSAIQATLDAVSKQLANIVSNGSSQQQTEESTVVSNENDVIEPITANEGGLSSADEEEEVRSNCDAESDHTCVEECLQDTQNKEDEYENEEIKSLETDNESAHCNEKVTNPEREEVTEEDIRLAKEQRGVELILNQQQRRLEQRPTQPLTPLQRPIILPGGRRWVDPEDASRSIRRPKMTDEKIANTIESYSEVLIGRAKGESNCWMVPSKVSTTKKINFLKYQPPAKSLDYLQRSEVYRLVHDMEPPVKGIARRPSKILSEEDYYQKTKYEVNEDK